MLDDNPINKLDFYSQQEPRFDNFFSYQTNERYLTRNHSS